MRKSIAIFLIGALAPCEPARAVRHIDPSAFPNAFQDKVHTPSAAQIRATGSLRAATLSNAIGTKTFAVILVQFPSADSTLTSGDKSILSFANIDGYFSQTTSYYKEVSYNKLTINFKFFGASGTTAGGETTAAAAGAFTMAKPMEYYGCGDEGTGCNGVATPTSPTVNANGNYLIRDALNLARAAQPTLNSTNFDEVVIVHAGNGNETTLSKGDIWSIFYSQDTVIQSAGAGFDEGDVVPETEISGITSPLGVICHEFGHSLGLPDLYNTSSSGGTSVVGNWEIMDSGPFTGSGANPSHPGAWAKATLGWAAPQTVTTKGNFSIGPIETSSSGLIKLPVKNGLSQEYFLVEYRLRTASGALFDHNIPGDGLLIWHVDDAISAARGVTATDPALANTVNTGSPHYGVSIVTADGVAMSGSNQGGSGNTFGDQGVFTNPKSNTLGGEASGISIVNISGIGSGTSSFDVANFTVTANQSISKVAAYPNPAGKGYAHPSGEGHATLQFQLTRPANDYQIHIYTLSGDLVRRIPKDAVTLNVSRSSDSKWVYEFDWDLKNGDGALVAPGIYLYLARADGLSKSGKAVVIR